MITKTANKLYAIIAGFCGLKHCIFRCAVRKNRQANCAVSRQFQNCMNNRSICKLCQAGFIFQAVCNVAL